jgi:subtilisin-like proprotein convertase family protein
MRPVEVPRRGGAFAALAALALQAAAGAEPFGQGFVLEVEPNGSAATATPLGGPTVVAQGQIVGGTDVDLWSFSASAGDRVHAAAVTSSSAQSSNSRLDLVASDGSTVLETDLDDGSLPALSSSIAGAPLGSGGTHYLRVQSQSPGGSTEIRPYRLYLRLQSGTPADEEEPNDATPQALPPGGWIAGTLDAGDKDLYSIDLGAGDTLFASLDADPERDGGATYDPALGVVLPGAPLDPIVVDDPNTTSPNSEAIVLTAGEAGTYQVEVAESGGAGGAAYTYRLSVGVLPASEQGASCATYASTDVPQSIASGPGRTTSALAVPGDPRIADLDLRLQLDHEAPDDLDLHLVSPAGNAVAIATDAGSALFPAWDLSFDDESAVPAGGYPIALLDGLGVQPEAGYRLDGFDGVDAGGDWTLVLDDDAAGGGGTLTAWSLRICTPEPLPACPEGTERQILLATDFEGGASGFTHSGAGDEWQLGLPSLAPIDSCASGSACWETDLDGDYANSSDQTLVSPEVDLAGTLGPVVVSWAQEFQLENATFDRYTVVVAVAGGGESAPLFEWTGGDMATTVGSTTLEMSAGWAVVERAAGAGFDGETVELRFRLTSDASETYDGVAIDDVAISACVPIEALFSDGFAAGDVCAWSVAVGSSDPCSP